MSDEPVLDENTVAIHVGDNVEISDDVRARLMDLASELSGDEVSGYLLAGDLVEQPDLNAKIRVRVRTNCAVDIIIKG